MAERTIFSKRYLAYALGIIFFANFLNYLDRNVVSALEDQITDSLNVSSAKFGLLWTAFTLGYMFVAPFIGYFADRMHRGRLFAACILIWSAATVGSGLANDYSVLFIMRMLIGIGEAGCLIIGPTLIVDYFPRRNRGRAMSVFFLGLPLGGAAGFVAAGIIQKYFGWRWAFYIAGLPGIAVAALVFFLRQPRRGASDMTDKEATDPGHAPLPKANFKSYIDLLRTPTLTYLILAQAFAAFTLVPLVHFSVSFFEERGLTKVVATSTLGTMALVAGLLGNTLGGFLGDWGRKRHVGSYAFLTAVGFLVGIPTTIYGLHFFPGLIGYTCMFLSLTMFFMCMPLINTQMANVVNPSQRAVAYAAAIFILHFLGDTLSPWLFGMVKDSSGALFAFTFFPLSLVLASLLSYKAWRTAPADVAAVNRRVEEKRSSLPEGNAQDNTP
jgi:predicted MFS family arabinose efflux permease